MAATTGRQTTPGRVRAAPLNGGELSVARTDWSDARYQAFTLLRIAFTVAPIAFGLDKFFNVMVDWPIYLAPWINDIAPGSGQDFMYLVGGIEILAGVLVAIKPRYGAPVVAAWLAGIIINLLTVPGFYDVALRDFGLLLGALTLARLALAYDPPLKDVIDMVLSVNAGYYAMEQSNARHEHEWRIWEDVKLPEGNKLIPGVVTHHTNVLEHPELVAQRLVRLANVVGRDNVLAGTDCGFAQGAFVRRVHPEIQWAKLAVLAEGARLATRELWGAAAAA